MNALERRSSRCDRYNRQRDQPEIHPQGTVIYVKEPELTLPRSYELIVCCVCICVSAENLSLVGEYNRREVGDTRNNI